MPARGLNHGSRANVIPFRSAVKRFQQKTEFSGVFPAYGAVRILGNAVAVLSGREFLDVALGPDTPKLPGKNCSFVLILRRDPNSTTPQPRLDHPRTPHYSVQLGCSLVFRPAVP